jgi:transposase
VPSFLLLQVDLSEAERDQLEAWSRRRTSAQALAQRSRIVLLAAEGVRTGAICERLGVHRNTVAKWRARFVEQRLEGMLDEPRPGRPRTVSDRDVDLVITKTLESSPKDSTHWSTRSMAAEVGLTHGPGASVRSAVVSGPGRR